MEACSTVLVELEPAKFCGGCRNVVAGAGGGGVIAGYKVAGEGSDRVDDA